MAFTAKDNNTVSFGLCDVKYAVLTYDASEKKYTIGDIEKIPGAVELNMPASGDEVEFYADNTLYYADYTNNGYDGTLTIAQVPEKMLVDVFGFEQDSTGAIFEKSSAKTKEIAMWFMFDGDKNEKKNCFYRCKLSRPDVAGKTTEKTKTPATAQLKIKAMPRLGDYLVKASLPNDASEAYTKFDTKLPEPAAAAPGVGG